MTEDGSQPLQPHNEGETTQPANDISGEPTLVPESLHEPSPLPQVGEGVGVSSVTGDATPDTTQQNDSLAQTESTEELESNPKLLVFDPEKFNAETKHQIDKWKNWAEGVGWSSDRIRYNVWDRQNERALLRVWTENFSGKVPEDWGEVWWKIVQDVEDTTVELSPEMVEAAIQYPLWHIPIALGESRILSDDQMHQIAMNPTMLHRNHPHAMEDLNEAQNLLRVKASQPAEE